MFNKKLALILASTASFVCAAENDTIAVSTEIIPEQIAIKPAPSNPKLKHYLIEVKAAYFCPQDASFRKMYHGGFIGFLELGYYFNKSLAMSLEGGYFHKHGMMTDMFISTTLTQVPVSLVLKYTINPDSRFNVYAKVGPNYLYTHETLHYPGFGQSTSNLIGATGGVGGIFTLGHGWLLDFFADYRYDRQNIDDTVIDNSTYLGGFDFGLGLGYRF